MTSERKRYFKAVGVGVALFVTIIFSTVYLLEKNSQRSIAASEHSVRLLLERSQAMLTDQTGDIDSRVTLSAQLAKEAVDILRDSSELSSRTRNRAGLIARILPLKAIIHSPDVSLSVHAQIVYGQLTWLEHALPALRRIAGYDASADVRNQDSHELFRRMYIARAGIARTIEDLRDPPPSLFSDDIRYAIVHSQNALAQTEPLIRLYDEGDVNTAAPLLQKYISESQDAARYAAQAVERFTSAEFLATLTNSI